MLLSRVKNFNLRTRAKYFAEDPSIPQGYPITDIRFDPRQTPEFGAMTSVALAFTDSIPTQYKNPLQNGVVNPHIYSTLMAPPITLILLHEPYAMVGRDSCLSAYHILTSARSIATLVHTIASTSYDCTKLGLFPVFAWFTSARVLTRFLRAALEEKYVEQIGVLKDEISFILRSLKRLSDRAPLAGRYARMLEDHVLKTCGAEAAASICPLDPTEMPGTIGFAPEMQEGDAADKILSMRLASLHAALSAGSTVTPSLPPFWPSSVTANTVE
ncbi:hypothetical protein EUX98_g6114 [Antrodiella citrinella]|uniref:Uncharacterized protein n=1 Tax=Antrodiella citrinella TaxID=2447956 RepID=A0A4S4MRP2_9APHY|nr:hypothetical protein EUX98_g6114 [Antrodiella citrinella]